MDGATGLALCYTFLLLLVSNVFWQRCDAVRRSELAERKRKARGCAKVCLLFAFHVNAAVCERVCCSLNCLRQTASRPKVVIRKIPKIRGVGVFCTQSFAAGATIVRYVGETVSFAEGQRRDQLRTEVNIQICVGLI